MHITDLDDDILNIIYKEININCHTCFCQFTFNINFYKKINKNYFCSKLCYEHT